jgi:hypothetical protein
MKRLDISKKFHDLIQGIDSVIQLPDPLGNHSFIDNQEK